MSELLSQEHSEPHIKAQLPIHLIPHTIYRINICEPLGSFHRDV